MKTPIDKAQVTLPGDTQVRVSREFRAPRVLVWQAHTDPKPVRRWMLGPPGWSMPVCEMDVRRGGVFAEVSSPARLRSDEIFADDWTGGETHVSRQFYEQDEGTQLTLTVLYASKEARDGAAASGMTSGMEHGYARLDEILSGLR